MKLQKIFDIIKKGQRVDIANCPGGVIFSSDCGHYFVRDLPSINTAEEFAAIFEIDSDKLPSWKIGIDSHRMAEVFMNIKRGLPLERGGALSFGSLKCVLFSKTSTSQISFIDSADDFKREFEGFIAIEPEKLNPLKDGIISFEYIEILGKVHICAKENGSTVALLPPMDVNEDNIRFIGTVAEELGKYYLK